MCGAYLAAGTLHVPLTVSHEYTTKYLETAPIEWERLGEDPDGIMTDSKEGEADRWDVLSVLEVNIGPPMQAGQWCVCVGLRLVQRQRAWERVH
jgi:hypothetical protein